MRIDESQLPGNWWEYLLSSIIIGKFICDLGLFPPRVDASEPVRFEGFLVNFWQLDNVECVCVVEEGVLSRGGFPHDVEFEHRGVAEPSGVEHWPYLALFRGTSILVPCAQFLWSFADFALLAWKKGENYLVNCSRSKILDKTPFKYNTFFIIRSDHWHGTIKDCFSLM